MNVETIEKLKRLADKCVFSMEGITIMKTEEYDNRLKQIEQLTNNWNELEEYIKQIAKDNNKRIPKDILQRRYMNGYYACNRDISDKMKEIKERYKNE